MSSEMDSCMKFIQDTAVMRLTLKEHYDQLEIKQVRIHPDTLAHLIGSSDIMKFMLPVMNENEKLSRIAGFDVKDDLSVPKGELYYVVKRND